MPLTSDAAFDGEYDVCVVGAGPAGLASGFAAHDHGLKVLILEAGDERPNPAGLTISPCSDGGLEIVSVAALGGTSTLWGGRVVPLDAFDFAAWPIALEDLVPWYHRAAQFLGVETLYERPPPEALARLKDFAAARCETWTPQPNMAKRWRARIASAQAPAIVLNARVVGFVHEPRRVSALHVRVGGEIRIVRAREFVLACGGLGTLRLMLMAQRSEPSFCGGEDGRLGRGYMGHVTGTICDLAPNDPTLIDAFGFHRLGADLYVRRQLHPRAETVAAHDLANVAFWLDDAASDDAGHGSPVASAKYVAANLVRRLASRGPPRAWAPLGPHFNNIARAPISATLGLAHASYLHTLARISGQRPRARRFLPVGDGAWHMRYHAEQRPDPANRIMLSATQTDASGAPQIKIRFQFSEADAASVVTAHELLDADLQQAGAGRLKWRATKQECAAMVRDCARDGCHQLGGAGMSEDPARGVVDADCRVHGTENLWLASGCVFPSGGQANPTLTIIALALRLAERLARGAHKQAAA